MNALRKIIRFLVEKQIKEKEELLTEPDRTEGREEEEASSGGVAGVTTPLGTGPTYPRKNKRPKNVRSPLASAASSFGGAKVVRKNKS